ncbi:hypothetical protein [Thiohalocapsa marina]|uniref:hypothetical protein n=1 Tax=Thiohalocapsa marina TaxID=424902 RepID=UPI0036DCFD4B
MAIARKPKPAAPAKKDADVDALIRKGGSVASQTKERTAASVVLRLPPDILSRVDAKVAERTVRIPRHQWLIEAVVEKLERESA